MFQRPISTQDVQDDLDTGEIIEECPDGRPYPARLVLGWLGRRPLHCGDSW